MPTNNPLDPDFVPPWLRDKYKGDDLEAQIAVAGLPNLGRQLDQPQVSKVFMERTEHDIITLADGRRCKLMKKLVIEMPGQIVGATEERVQEFWRGPKQLGIIRSEEWTNWGMLVQVSFGYPNHEPTLEDVRQIKSAFYPEDTKVFYAVPPVDIPLEDRNLVSLLEMPPGLGALTIARDN